jgi:hypothetical protein
MVFLYGLRFKQIKMLTTLGVGSINSINYNWNEE